MSDIETIARNMPNTINGEGISIKKINPNTAAAIGVEKKNGTTFLNPGSAKDGRMAIVDITDGNISVTMIGPTDH